MTRAPLGSDEGGAGRATTSRPVDGAPASRAAGLALPPAAAWALAAYALLAVGAAVPYTLVVGVPLVTLAFCAAVRAALVADRAAFGRSPRRVAALPPHLLHAGLAALAVLPAILPAPGPAAPLYVHATRAFAWLAPLLLGLHGGGGHTLRRIAFVLLLAGALGLQALTPLAVPNPEIDVWSWTQHCARALLDGVHPYIARAPDVYRGGWRYGYELDVYVYPPLDLLVAAPFVALLHDYRFALVAANVGAVLLLRAAARSFGFEPMRAELFALALALHPRAAWMLGFGWLDTLLVFALTLFLYLRARAPGGRLEAVVFLLLPAIKQYVVAPVVLYLALLRPRPRHVLLGVAVALATVAPFLAARPRATLDGLFFIVRHTAFRDDSLSLAALVARLTGYRVGKTPALVAQLVVAAAAGHRLRHEGVAGLLLASALALLATFLVGTQAFLNYYYVIGALLLLSACAFASPRDERGPPAA